MACSLTRPPVGRLGEAPIREGGPDLVTSQGRAPPICLEVLSKTLEMKVHCSYECNIRESGAGTDRESGYQVRVAHGSTKHFSVG